MGVSEGLSVTFQVSLLFHCCDFRQKFHQSLISHFVMRGVGIDDRARSSTVHLSATTHAGDRHVNLSAKAIIVTRLGSVSFASYLASVVMTWKSARSIKCTRVHRDSEEYWALTYLSRRRDKRFRKISGISVSDNSNKSKFASSLNKSTLLKWLKIHLIEIHFFYEENPIVILNESWTFELQDLEIWSVIYSAAWSYTYFTTL